MNNYEHDFAARHGVRAATLASGMAIALLLAACGGGGGNPGTTGGSGSGSTGGGSTGNGGSGTVTNSAAVTLAFSNAGGASTNALSGATPLTVKATVLDANKKPVPNAIVTFATDNSLATFSPTAGTALTDANGVASVTMRAASLAAGGAGTVTATTSVAGATVSGTGNYSVGATTLAFGALSASPSSLQAYGSTVLSVDLLSGGAKYTSQQVNVSFSSACVTAGKATLAATVATNNGTAQTVYRDKGCANNDTITVSADGIAQAATTAVTIAPPSAASVQFVGATPTNQSIVIQGQGGNGRTETAVLTFKVVDSFGNPLAGKQVNFSTASPYVRINKASDTTDASGSVITTVNSGTTPTSFRVQATLPGTASGTGPDISTMSDSIVVTNGLPVQRAFTLATDKFNVEGWNILNGSAATITVSLGDAFGNLVPDGTPIVFQTNMGAVGSSSTGGCNTVNGNCSVPFRTQQPFTATPGLPATPCNAASPDATRAGLATICASTTDGSNVLYQKTAIFFSGSTAVNTFMSGTKVSFDATNPNDLGTIASSATKVFQLELNDVNLNPMPAGSRVEITSMLNGNASAVVPATVPNIAPHGTTNVDDPTGNSISGNQGSTHTFSISSTQPTECKNATQASFNVTVTTPLGSVTNIPFKLSFTCP
ncbi:Ig-like domain-containing protein [Massilia sp. YIM B02763]|uniref:Ig-like domain-containing protein n=1 Tax=Massilia sp. YIM B02763 TaxID=3050130 RepID=UPI0025B67096|nr:Ig-like domain-containing protein [Massilia sp. YIM B02763]MDN4055756.1 Ig-like domain-containing protein [Massilia sp. YIM B02763]